MPFNPFERAYEKYSQTTFNHQLQHPYLMRNRGMLHRRAKAHGYGPMPRQTPRKNAAALSKNMPWLSPTAKGRLIKRRLMPYLRNRVSRADVWAARQAEWRFMWQLFGRNYQRLPALIQRLNNARRYDDVDFALRLQAAYEPHYQRFDASAYWPDLMYALRAVRAVYKSGKVRWVGHDELLRKVAHSKKDNEFEVIYFFQRLPIPEPDAYTDTSWVVGHDPRIQLDTGRYPYLLPPVRVQDQNILSYALFSCYMALKTCAAYFQGDIKQFTPAVLFSVLTQTLLDSHGFKKLTTEFYDYQFDKKQKFDENGHPAASGTGRGTPNLFYQAVRDILEQYRFILSQEFPGIETTSAILEDEEHNKKQLALPPNLWYMRRQLR